MCKQYTVCLNALSRKNVIKSKNYVTKVLDAGANLRWMINSGSPETQLLQFICDHHLKKPNGVVLFDAMVSFYQKEESRDIFSEIQVITLPDCMALYILTFFNDKYGMPELYTTRDYIFNYPEASKIEIHLKDNAGFVLSLKALQKGQPV